MNVEESSEAMSNCVVLASVNSFPLDTTMLDAEVGIDVLEMTRAAELDPSEVFTALMTSSAVVVDFVVACPDTLMATVAVVISELLEAGAEMLVETGCRTLGDIDTLPLLVENTAEASVVAEMNIVVAEVDVRVAPAAVVVESKTEKAEVVPE